MIREIPGLNVKGLKFLKSWSETFNSWWQVLEFIKVTMERVTNIPKLSMGVTKFTYPNRVSSCFLGFNSLHEASYIRFRINLMVGQKHSWVTKQDWKFYTHPLHMAHAGYSPYLPKDRSFNSLKIKLSYSPNKSIFWCFWCSKLQHPREGQRNMEQIWMSNKEDINLPLEWINKGSYTNLINETIKKYISQVSGI